MGSGRFLYSNLITAESMISVSSLRNGLVTAALKEGLGSAVLNPSGGFTGPVDLEYIVEIDSIAAGAEVGQATFRWSDGGGTWDATGVTTSAVNTLLNNGVYINFTTGSGADFVVGDRWYFKAINLFNAGKMIDLDRDHRYRSAALGAPNTVTVDLGSAQEVKAIVLQDHNFTSAATLKIEGSADNTFPYYENVGSNKITTWVNHDTFPYGTLTQAGGNITSAIAGGASACYIDIGAGLVNGRTYRLVINHTQSSGEAPSLYLGLAGDLASGGDLTIAAVSPGATTVVFTFSTAGYTRLIFANTAAANWACTVTLYEVDEISEVITWNEEKIIHYLAAPLTYRYWRLSVTDAANPDGFLEIGELYIGSYLELTRNYIEGFSEETNFLMDSNRTPYGAGKDRFYNSQLTFNFSFGAMPPADVTSMKALIAAIASRSSGTFKPFWFCKDSATPNDSYLVKIASLPVQHRTRDYYDMPLVLTECVTSV